MTALRTFGADCEAIGCGVGVFGTQWPRRVYWLVYDRAPHLQCFAAIIVADHIFFPPFQSGYTLRLAQMAILSPSTLSAE